MKNKHSYRSRFLILAGVLLTISLACGNYVESILRITQKDQNQLIAATIDVRPGSTPGPTATPTPLPAGMTRSNPLSKLEVVSAPNWDVQILDIKRGEAAWLDIQAANRFNEPAPAGMEYLLIKIRATSTYTDHEDHRISVCDFKVTGDCFIKYTCGMALVVEPEPELDARLFTGGTAEGWAAFRVAQGETNLMLIFDETMNFTDGSQRYIALDDGASIHVSSELAGIPPGQSGTDHNAPAPRDEKVITEDWEVSIVDVIRGDAAWEMVQEENQFNDPPAAGYEYIAVKTHVRYIGMDERGVNIRGSFFKSTGDEGVLYDAPGVVDPSPRLDVWLFPGGEYEGWVVIQAAQGETNVSLIFEPLFDLSGNNKRFISIDA